MHLVPRNSLCWVKQLWTPGQVCWLWYNWKELIWIKTEAGVLGCFGLGCLGLFHLNQMKIWLWSKTLKQSARLEYIFQEQSSEVLWEGASGALGVHQFKQHQCPAHRISNRALHNPVYCSLLLSGHGGKIVRLPRHPAGLFISSVSMGLGSNYLLPLTLNLFSINSLICLLYHRNICVVHSLNENSACFKINLRMPFRMWSSPYFYFYFIYVWL